MTTVESIDGMTVADAFNEGRRDGMADKARSLTYWFRCIDTYKRLLDANSSLQWRAYVAGYKLGV